MALEVARVRIGVRAQQRRTGASLNRGRPSGPCAVSTEPNVTCRISRASNCSSRDGSSASGTSFASGARPQLGRDVIARLVRVVALAREGVDLAEERGVERGHGAQRLEVARARGLEVDEPLREARGDRVDAELVRARVQAQLVRPEVPRDRGVGGDVLLELGRGRRCSRRPSRSGRRSAARGSPRPRRAARARPRPSSAPPARSASPSRPPRPRARRAARLPQRAGGATSARRAPRRART